MRLLNWSILEHHLPNVAPTTKFYIMEKQAYNSLPRNKIFFEKLYA